MLLDTSRPLRCHVTSGTGRPNPAMERNSVALVLDSSLVAFEVTSTVAAVEWNMGMQ